MERVFLVSGVVKTVFCRFKKKRFFCFSPRTKESKARLRGISKSTLFPTETLRICSITSWSGAERERERGGKTGGGGGGGGEYYYNIIIL